MQNFNPMNLIDSLNPSLGSQIQETVMKSNMLAILVAVMATFINPNLALAGTCNKDLVTGQPNPVSALADNASCDDVTAATEWLLASSGSGCTVNNFPKLKAANAKCDGGSVDNLPLPKLSEAAADSLLTRYCPNAELFLAIQTQLKLDGRTESVVGLYDSMAAGIAQDAAKRRNPRKVAEALSVANTALGAVREEVITPVINSIPNKRSKRDQLLDQVNNCLEAAGFHRDSTPVAEARARYNEKKKLYDTLMSADDRDESAIDTAKGKLLSADSAWSDAIKANPWQDEGFSLRFLEALKAALANLPEEEVNPIRPFLKAAEEADLSPDKRMLLMWTGMGKLPKARLNFLTTSSSPSTGLTEVSSPDEWDGKYVTVQLAADSDPNGDGLRHGIASKGENGALALSTSDGTVIETIPADASKRVFIHTNAGSGGPSSEELLADNVGKTVKVPLSDGSVLEGPLTQNDDGDYFIGETPVDPTMVASVIVVEERIVETERIVEIDSLGVGTTIFGRDSRPFGIPPLTLSVGFDWHEGAGTDTRYGRDFAVASKGWGLNLELGLEGSWQLASSVHLLYGGGLFGGYRATNFRDETAAAGKFSTSDGFTFGGFGSLGVNFGEWLTVYGIAKGRIAPAGFDAGGGLKLTGLGPFRVGAEATYGFAHNQSATGIPNGSAADFSGWSVGSKIGVVF